MKKSARALRIERHHKRMSKTSKLSLVSLMDIFTILVFFLIVNSSNVEVLQAEKSIKLPQSISKKLARENLLLVINKTHITLQGKEIISLDSLKNIELITIDKLAIELEYHKTRQTPTESGTRGITVMGDQKLEYSLLKKILFTCSKSGFTDISLAVEKTIVEQVGDVNE